MEIEIKDRTGKKINLTLVGQWQDLAYYYRGDDGNYWSLANGQFSAHVNHGPKLRNLRGKTLDGKDIETLPDLSIK